MQAGQVLATTLTGVGFVAAVVASLHALLNKRRPQSAFGWIAVCLALPLAGALLYYLFGVNRVETRARKLLTRHPELECPTEYVGTPPPQLLPLARLGQAVSGWPLTAGKRLNQVRWDEEKRAALELAEAHGYLGATFTEHRIEADLVRNEATSLQTKLSRQDKPRVDEYLTSVREVERRIMNVSMMPSMMSAISSAV